MTSEPQVDSNSKWVFADTLAVPTKQRLDKSVVIVRAESELLAIDQLMAELSNEQVRQ